MEDPQLTNQMPSIFRVVDFDFGFGFQFSFPKSSVLLTDHFLLFLSPSSPLSPFPH